MRINHNISAMMTQTALFSTQRTMSKNLERLSTGLRINSAADDAAGLGVSENLRTQVRGTQQANKNTQDAISLLQIADGALEEQAAILQRMRELVLQAKNDTYTETENKYMSEEFGELYSELDRIAKTSNFNGMQLFSDQSTVDSPDGEPKGAREDENIWDGGVYGPLGADDQKTAHHFNMMIGANYTQKDADAFNPGGQLNSYDKDAANIVTIQLAQMDARALFQSDEAIGNPEDVFTFFGGSDWLNYTDAEDNSGIYDNRQSKLSALLKIIDGDGEDIQTAGLEGTNVSGLERVNKQRAYIGAMINRFEHTVNNLNTSRTNQQNAESIIRDTDFAEESTQFTKNQIITQSATSMLSQANMAPQSALQLIR